MIIITVEPTSSWVQSTSTSFISCESSLKTEKLSTVSWSKLSIVLTSLFLVSSFMDIGLSEESRSLIIQLWTPTVVTERNLLRTPG